jgi:hypothetical protein
MQDVRRLDRSIDASLWGGRTIDFDPEIRALVKLAVRMRSPGERLSPARRQAIRERVFANLAEGNATTPRPVRWPGGRAARSLARSAAVLLLGVSLAAGAATAGARSVPGESVQAWKVALDDARVQLAR